MKENVIISCGVGAWHPQGIARLERSLENVGWGGDTLLFNSYYPPNSPTHQQMPYAFKVYAFFAAIERGHRYILWCDSSVWAVKNPEPIFAIIQNQGYYLWNSGYTCDCWCNDPTLEAFKLTREQAHQVPMISANIMGFDVESEIGKEFLDTWKDAMELGLFAGPWTKQPGDPETPPYMGHRHDQSAASLIANQMGLKLERWGINCQYDEDDRSRISPTICLTLRGM